MDEVDARLGALLEERGARQAVGLDHRQRADRVVVGEVRRGAGTEAALRVLDLLQVLESLANRLPVLAVLVGFRVAEEREQGEPGDSGIPGLVTGAVGEIGRLVQLREAIAVPEAARVLVIGTGYNGRMKVPLQTLEALQAKGIEARISRTTEAVDAFNRLTGEGADAVAALHLTC